MPRTSGAPLRWRQLATLSLIVGLSCIIYPLSVMQGGSLVTLILASEDTPSGAVVRQDFPDATLERGFGHDGQYFYVAARQPFDPGAAADGLDRPRYRLQRVLFPLLAGIGHPGGGPGLIVALVTVGLLSIALGVAATASLLHLLGGRWRFGCLFALLPGAYWSMRLTTSDMLALALAIAATTLSLRQRTGTAVLAGCLAVLAKEPVWLVLAGVALWRRDRAGALLAAVPAAVAGLWFLALRVLVTDTSQQVVEFTWPLRGYYEAWRLGWSNGIAINGLIVAAVTIGVAIAALRRHGLRSPLSWPIALHLALFTVMNENVIGLPDNNSRTMAPLLLLGLVALLVPPAPARAEAIVDLGIAAPSDDDLATSSSISSQASTA